MDVETNSNSNNQEEQDLIKRTRGATIAFDNSTMKQYRFLQPSKAKLVMSLTVVTIFLSWSFFFTNVVPNPSYNEELKQKDDSTSDELQHIVDSTSNVVITMPAKAAGTSLKEFQRQCFNGTAYKDNFLNSIKANGAMFLTYSYELPRVIASHTYTVETLVHIINNVPSQTLMIYSHRDETDRLLSSIGQVLGVWCNRVLPPPEGFFSIESKNTNTCYVTEKNLIEIAIKQKHNEIGLGSTRLLTCGFYHALEKNAPNFLFMDFKKADKLMDRLAEKYCPHLVGEPVKENIANEKIVSLFVQVPNKLSGEDDIVPLKEWMHVKRDYIQLMLGLTDGASCRAKTRVMENMLFASNGFVNAVDVFKEIG